MKISSKVLSSVMALALVASMGTSVFATELTGDNLADTAKLDTTAGTYDGTVYNEFEGDGTAAGKASSVVVVDAEATTFKVTVPIALHVAQDVNGAKTYADDMKAGSTGAAKIINECALGQVKITYVEVVPTTGYTISAFDADYSNMKVNSKTFGFKINGAEVGTDGSVISTPATDTISSVLVKADDGKTDLTRVYADYTFTKTGASAFPIVANSSVLPITYEAKLPAFSQAVTDANVGGVVFTIDFN